jgi:hypothetical protein
MKTQIKRILMVFMTCIAVFQSMAQSNGKQMIAVMNIDAKGIAYDASTLAYIVRLEVEKSGKFNIIDKYEMADVFEQKKHHAETCFSRACLVQAGEMLKADKVLSGDIARFGEKIIITLRLIDVKAETIERSEAIEYLNIDKELQKMIEISVKRLFDIAPDNQVVNQLVNYDVPVNSPKTRLRLNGPRMGATYTLGETGDRLSAPENEGGFDMYRASVQFGYQKEMQYLSSGDFQALVEFVGMVGGLENGRFVPSITMLNGFRFGKSGWEIGFGPTLRFIKKADGFFDTDGILGEAGRWHLQDEWNDYSETIGEGQLNPYPIISRLDSRGDVKASAGLVIAAGRTFKSGYLNVPVNVWASPRKDGWTLGFSFGFNVSKKPKP